MTRSVAAKFLISLSVVLMALGQPLASGLTTIRLGFLLLIASTVLLRPKVGRDLLVSYSLLLLMPSFIAFSGFANAVYDQALIATFSVALLTFAAFLLSSNIRMLSGEDIAFICKFFALTVILLMIVIYLSICLSVGGLAFGYAARVWVDNVIPSGLSRLMNGFSILVLLSLWGLPALLRGRMDQYIAPLVILVFSLFAIFTGSRQSLILVPLFVALVLLHSRARHTLRVVGLLIFIALSFSMVEISDTLREWVGQRFTLSSEPTESDELRAYLWTEAMRSAFENPFSGLGPTTFVERYGHYPHNGLLGFAVTVGLMPAIIYFLLVCMIYGYLVLARHSLTRRERIFFLISSFALIVMMMLNDLLLDPIFYIFLAFSIGAASKGRRLRS